MCNLRKTWTWPCVTFTYKQVSNALASDLLSYNCYRTMSDQWDMSAASEQRFYTEPPSLFELRFHSPVNKLRACWVRSIYLATLLLGRLSPLNDWLVFCTFFCQKLTTALLESAEGSDDRRKYFIIYLHKRMLPNATSWVPVRQAFNWATEDGSEQPRIMKWE